MTLKFNGFKPKRNFHTILNFVLFQKYEMYENKYRTKICDFTVFSLRRHVDAQSPSIRIVTVNQATSGRFLCFSPGDFGSRFVFFNAEQRRQERRFLQANLLVFAFPVFSNNFWRHI